MNVVNLRQTMRESGKVFIRKDMMCKEGIRGLGPSKIMVGFNKCHPSEAEIERYNVEKMEEDCVQITMQQTTGDLTKYTMRKNRFECNFVLGHV